MHDTAIVEHHGMHPKHSGRVARPERLVQEQPHRLEGATMTSSPFVLTVCQRPRFHVEGSLVNSISPLGGVLHVASKQAKCVP